MKGNKPKKTEDYGKYQWEYKKAHYYTVPLVLKIDADADLIRDLRNFEGNRNEWLKQLIRKALAEKKS